VRLPNPRLVRLGSVAGGAITEQGDGELVIPPYVQPIIELSSPINRIATPSAPLIGRQTDSFFVDARTFTAGVTVQAATTLATMSRGSWVLEVFTSLQLTGSTAQNAGDGTGQSGLFLQDPDGNLSGLIAFNNMLGGVAAQMFWDAMERTLHFIFQRDDFLLLQYTGATAGADARLAIASSINARRIV